MRGDTEIIFLSFLPMILFIAYLISLRNWFELIFVTTIVMSISSRLALASHGPNQKFKFQHQYSIQANIVQGISLGCWLEILYTRRDWIEWRIYWFRILVLTLLATINSVFAILEHIMYGKAISNTTISDRPVFIIGHPRTGTTHLFNVLAKDTKQFLFPNTFQCGFPNGMILLSKAKFLFAGMVAKTRPMDNVRLDLDQPQEDEIAVNVLSAGRSAYMPLLFMTHAKEFYKYFSFQSASQKDKAIWIEAFKYFLQKLTFANGNSDKRPLLKSPCHTSRVLLLHQLFPKAQFIYIYREPYVVYKSAVNMAQTTYWYNYLAVPKDEQIEEFILSQYEMMYNDYIQAKEVIPQENLIEISYNNLTHEPEQTLESIYQYFHWDSWSSFKPELKAYLDSIKSYSKNEFAALPPKVREEVHKRWKASFKTFGFDA